MATKRSALDKRLSMRGESDRTGDFGGDETGKRRPAETRSCSNECEQARARGKANGATDAVMDGRDYEGEYGDGDHIGITGTCGKRKSGKTFLQWISINLCHHRLAVFDPERQYRPPKYDTKGFVTVHTPKELKEAIQTNRLQARIIYQPLAGSKLWHFRTTTEIVLRWGDWLFKRGMGLVYFVDEIDTYVPPHEKLEILVPELNQAIEYGRHHGVTLGWTSRRPYKVHPNLRAQTMTFRVFKTNEPNDKKYFDKALGSEPSHNLSNLGKYEYVWWTDDAERDWEIRGGRK